MKKIKIGTSCTIEQSNLASLKLLSKKLDRSVNYLIGEAVNDFLKKYSRNTTEAVTA